MATNTTFANASNFLTTGSNFKVGTALLRYDPGGPLGTGSDILNTARISLGKCEKIGIKTTGTELELEDENGETEAYMMLNNGEDLSITARFTNDVPDPKKGQIISIIRRKSTIIRSTRAFTAIAAVTVGTSTNRAKITMASTTGYVVGDLITISGASVGSWNGIVAPILAFDATSITLDTLFSFATATGNVTAPPAVVSFTRTWSNVIDDFLITDVSENYGTKEVAKYDLTAKRWESMTPGNAYTATVVTSTGALLTKEVAPVLPTVS